MAIRISKIELYKKSNYFGTPVNITSGYSSQFSKLKISFELNQPSTLEMGLIKLNETWDIDIADRIVVYKTEISGASQVETVLFSGYISSTPVWSFIGSKKTRTSADPAPIQGWGYQITAYGPDGLLNVKGIPYNVPPYVNKTHYDILIDLARRCQNSSDSEQQLITSPLFTDSKATSAPGSTSAKGNTESFYVADPGKKWSEIAKDFAELDNFRYWFDGTTFFYEPILTETEYLDTEFTDKDNYTSTVMLTDDGSDPKFTLGNLDIKPESFDYKNDVTVVGAECPLYPVVEETIADGFTGSFNLRSLPYGVSNTDLISETWNVSEIPSDKWYVSQGAATTPPYSANNEAFNISGSSEDVIGSNYVMATSAIEMAGVTVFRPGEIVFTQISLGAQGTSHGYLGGLYESTTPGIVAPKYGFKFDTATDVNRITAIVDQTEITETQVTIEANKAYVPRMIISVDEPQRIIQNYYQEYQSGINPILSSNGRITLEIEVYNILDTTDIQYITLFTGEIKDIPVAMFYFLANQKNLHCYLTSTKASNPPQIEVFLESNDGTKRQIKMGDALDGADATITVSGESAALVFYDTRSDGKTKNTPNLGDKLKIRYWANGKASARVKDVWSIRDYRTVDPSAPVGGSAASNLIVQGTASTATLDGTTLTITCVDEPQFNVAENTYASCLIDWTGVTSGLTIASSNKLQIVVANVTEAQRTSLMGSDKVFRIYRTNYRFFDDGVRSIVIDNLSPLPRNDREAELAAKAYLWDHTREKWSGSYAGVVDHNLKGIPQVGAIVCVDSSFYDSVRQPVSRDINPVLQPLITRIDKVIVEEVGSAINPLDGKQNSAILVNMEFSTQSKLDNLLNQFVINRNGIIFNKETITNLPNTSKAIPWQQDLNTVPDVPAVSLKSLTSSKATFEIHSTGTDKYVEVRNNKDWGWGTTGGNHIIPDGQSGNAQLAASTSTVITIDRSKLSRRSALYFRLTTASTPSASNNYSYHSTVMIVNYPTVPPPPTEIKTILDTNYTLSANIPTLNKTVDIANHTANGTYYISDIAGIEIRDKYRNLIYKGAGVDETTFQTPGFNTLKATTGKSDYLFTKLLTSSDVLLQENSSTIIPLTIGSTTYYTHKLSLAGTPLDQNGKTWNANQFAGKLLTLGLMSGTLFQAPILASGSNYLQFKINQESPITENLTGVTSYINVATTCETSISSSTLTIKWPVPFNDETYRDTYDYYVKTYNLLGETNYANKILSKAIDGNGRLVLTMEDAVDIAAVFDSKFTYGGSSYNQFCFSVGDWIVLEPATANGNSSISYKQIYAINDKQITCVGTGEVEGGFTDLVNGHIYKLVRFCNPKPECTGAAVTTDTANLNKSISWTGINALYYDLYLKSTITGTQEIVKGDYPIWNSWTNYYIGETVLYSGSYYMRTQEYSEWGISYPTPDNDTGNWEQVQPETETETYDEATPYERTIRINHPANENVSAVVTYSALTDSEKTKLLEWKITAYDNFGAIAGSTNTETTNDTDVPETPSVIVGQQNRTVTFTIKAPTTPSNWKSVSKITLKVSSSEDFSSGTQTYVYEDNATNTINTSTVIIETWNAPADGKYYYSVTATNSFGDSTAATGTLKLYWGSTVGDYTDDWFGFFLYDKFLGGRQEISGTGTLNPAVVVIGSGYYDNRKKVVDQQTGAVTGGDFVDPTKEVSDDVDPIYPNLVPGMLCIADNVKTAIEDPTAAAYYFKIDPTAGYKIYNSTINYAVYELVYYKQKIYKSLANNNLGNIPSSTPAQWEYLADAPVLLDLKGQMHITGDSTIQGTLTLTDNNSVICGNRSGFHTQMQSGGIFGWAGKDVDYGGEWSNLMFGFFHTNLASPFVKDGISYQPQAGDFFAHAGYIQTLAIASGGFRAGLASTKHTVFSAEGLFAYNDATESASNLNFAIFNADKFGALAGDLWVKRGYFGGATTSIAIEVSESYIRSSNFNAATEGFSINTNGTADFYSVTIRSGGNTTSTSSLVYAGSLTGNYVSDWYGIFIAGYGMVGRDKKNSTRNPAVFLLGADTYNCAHTSYGGQYTGSEAEDPIHPSWAPGDFCIADDIKQAMLPDGGTSTAYLKFRPSLGLFKLKSAVDIIGTSTVTGDLTVIGNIRAYSPTESQKHVLINSYGVNCVNGTEFVGNDINWSVYSAGFINVPVSGTINGYPVSLQAGDFYAKSGYLGGVKIKDGGLIIGSESSFHVVINPTGICAWKAQEKDGNNQWILSNVNFAIFNDTFTINGATIGKAGDLWIRNGYFAGSNTDSTIVVTGDYITSPYFDANKGAYSASTPYVIGDVVSYNEKRYKSIYGTVGSPNTGHTPGASGSSSYWTEVPVGFRLMVDGKAYFESVMIRIGNGINDPIPGLDNCVYSGSQIGNYLKDWYGIFFTGRALAGKQKVDTTNSPNPLVFLLCANSYNNLRKGTGVGGTGDYAGSEAEDPVFPTFAPGDFCVATDVREAYKTSGGTCTAYFKFIASTGSMSIKSDITITGTSSIVGDIYNTGNIFSGSRSSYHTQMASSGFFGWSGDDSTVANMTFAVSNATFTNVPLYGRTVTIVPGEFVAKVGYIGDLRVETGGIQSVNTSGPHWKINKDFIAAWNGPETDANLTFKIHITDPDGAGPILAGDAWFKRGFFGGSSSVADAMEVSGTYIKSSSYSAKTAGFIINNSGSAEFNDVTIRVNGSTSEGVCTGGTLWSGVMSGNYSTDWYGVFITSAGIVGRQNKGTGVANPPVFLLGANSSAADTMHPAWASGDFCVATNVKTAYETPTSCTAYIKFRPAEAVPLEIKGNISLAAGSKIIGEMNIDSDGVIFAGVRSSYHSQFANTGIYGWIGYDTEYGDQYLTNCVFGFSTVAWGKVTYGKTRFNFTEGKFLARTGYIGCLDISSTSVQSIGYDADLWASGVSYVQYDIVKYGSDDSCRYKALTNHTANAGNSPISLSWSTYWSKIPRGFKIDNTGVASFDNVSVSVTGTKKLTENVMTGYTTENGISRPVIVAGYFELKDVTTTTYTNTDYGVILSREGLFGRNNVGSASDKNPCVFLLGAIPSTTTDTVYPTFAAGDLCFSSDVYLAYTAPDSVSSYLKFTVADGLTMKGNFITNTGGMVGTGGTFHFWAGDTYANRNTAPFQVRSDGDTYFNYISSSSPYIRIYGDPNIAEMRILGANNAACVQQYVMTGGGYSSPALFMARMTTAGATAGCTYYDTGGMWFLNSSGEMTVQLVSYGTTAQVKITGDAAVSGVYVNNNRVLGPRQTACNTINWATIDATYGTDEAGVISNLRTIISQLITKLQAHGLIA